MSYIPLRVRSTGFIETRRVRALHTPPERCLLLTQPSDSLNARGNAKHGITNLRIEGLYTCARLMIDSREVAVWRPGDRPITELLGLHANILPITAPIKLSLDLTEIEGQVTVYYDVHQIAIDSYGAYNYLDQQVTGPLRGYAGHNTIVLTQSQSHLKVISSDVTVEHIAIQQEPEAIYITYVASVEHETTIFGYINRHIMFYGRL